MNAWTFLLLLTYTIVSANSSLAQTEEEKYDPDKLVLISAQSFQEGEQTYLAISFKNESHWHTYWKNPGDAGQEISLRFSSQNTPLKLVELQWPVPKRYIEEGDILAFGYEDQYSLFFQIPDEALATIKKTGMSIGLNWLVCKHLCIPGQKTIQGQWVNNQFFSPDNQLPLLSVEELLARKKILPMPSSWPAELEVFLQADGEENRLWLLYQLKTESHQVHSTGILLPYPHPAYSSKQEEIFVAQDQSLFGKIRLHWEGQYLEPAQTIPASGQFSPELEMSFLYLSPGSNRAVKITKKIESFSTQVFNQNQLKAMTTLNSTQNSLHQDDAGAMPQPANDNTDLGQFLLLALLGGIILNIMPCVLPVISLKLFGLVAHAQENRAQLIGHNLAYTAGVLASFVSLAGAVIILKNLGTQVGWGFQMQSPNFIGFMIVMLFVLALNLFGLFEFATPGGKHLGSVKVENSLWGDFLGGVLSTILATPCSAPFLGTALTFAFTSGNKQIVLIFLFIGLGLSLPFLFTALFPASIRWLPRPGHWMNHLKKFLGLTLLLTIVWLMDVLVALEPSSLSFIALLSCLIFSFFAFYYRSHIGKKQWLKNFFSIIPIFFFLLFLRSSSELDVKNLSSSDPTQKSSSKLQWEPWSEQKMQEYQGQWVFMNFTAKWCFTCIANEKIVLATDDFLHLSLESKLKLLKGDWTKRDPAITQFLEKNHRFGVPSYFLQSPRGKLIELGETISIGKIKETMSKNQ